jgi:hypothetical protein
MPTGAATIKRSGHTMLSCENAIAVAASFRVVVNALSGR